MTLPGYFMRDDPDACHVVLGVPWKRRTYYFEGSGLTSVLAKAQQLRHEELDDAGIKNGAID